MTFHLEVGSLLLSGKLRWPSGRGVRLCMERSWGLSPLVSRCVSLSKTYLHTVRERPLDFGGRGVGGGGGGWRMFLGPGNFFFSPNHDPVFLVVCVVVYVQSIQ